MSSKAQVKAQAKTAATPGPVHVGQPPVALPEREADRPDIATQLEGAVRLGHSLAAVRVDSSAPLAIQRQEIPDEEEEIQMKPADGVRRRGRGEGFRLDDETAGRINRARGGGQPLNGVLQVQMGETMGHDFSGVRVHTDAEADVLNQQLSARAFTTGRDIFFRRGKYNPGSGPGRELIAHELTHVVQQSTGRMHGSGSGMTVRPSGDGFETQAAGIAWRATVLQDRGGDEGPNIETRSQVAEADGGQGANLFQNASVHAAPAGDRIGPEQDSSGQVSTVGQASIGHKLSPSVQGALGVIQRQDEVRMGEWKVGGPGGNGLSTDGIATCVGVAAYSDVTRRYGLIHVEASDYSESALREMGDRAERTAAEAHGRLAQVQQMVGEVGGDARIWISCSTIVDPRHIYDAIVTSYGQATNLSSPGRNRMAITAAGACSVT